MITASSLNNTGEEVKLNKYFRDIISNELQSNLNALTDKRLRFFGSMTGFWL